ncbi:MAG: DUF3536 domain-containing protein [Candidatus Omnitrophica bacterium]|nr:DUF3536 domain-containing protein [Candidatus Omnitrophota bacterium]
MKRFVCIHGHFYQPPRENPWLQEVEIQDSAYPYHDWNERVTVECYARNAHARILDDKHKISDIINNYSRISFNFGPTLLSWMQRKDPAVYADILEADALSRTNFSGHGSAMAQVYNHIIMPLANSRDKRTQVVWGIKDFEYRFKRKPEGMWLAETAVDLETLDIMAEQGIKFTILAPHQAKRVKYTGQDMLWRDVALNSVDPHVAYLCRLPSGRTIHIFFYDGPITQGVAFGGLLNNGEDFAKRLTSDNAHVPDPRIVHIATDGETYGHHHKFGDMALAYCLHFLEEGVLAKLTVYGEFLEKFPVTHEVEIVANSSWSCAHGIERWRSNCGCSTGGQSGWHQMWRAPLREALDWLRDRLIPVYEQQMSAYTLDPWGLRDAYIDVILERSPECAQRFLREHLSKVPPEEEKIRILKLLEMQLNALLMYTSCGWFFNEISGIETVQILKYAARAVQLAKEASGIDVQGDFVRILERAPSNVPELKNGGVVYRSMVVPSVVDLLRVGAHYAMTSLFEQYPQQARLYAYTVKTGEYILKEAGRQRLAVGRGRVACDITGEQADIQFAVLHLGGHNFIGQADHFKPGDYARMQGDLTEAFSESNIPEVINLINRYFGSKNYSLWHLFKQEQQNILNQVLRSAMEDIETSFRHIYEHHYPLMQIKNEGHLPLPRMLITVVEFILNRDVCAVLEKDDVDIDRLKGLVEEMKRWAFKRDQANFGFLAGQRLNSLMRRLNEHPHDIPLMTKITTILEIFGGLSMDLDLWEAQNVYFEMAHTVYPDIAGPGGADPDLHWVKTFEYLGDILQVRTPS